MFAYYTKDFEKQFLRIDKTIQSKFKERLDLFLLDQTHPVLRVHSLKGKYVGYMSMNVNGDIRALYKEEGEQIVIFAFIGSHSQLYG
ncbi:MAG: type II toxin-antitoxin system mRNA interferase toxin, RelE/StbE family [Candidatus Pacebacteria bacterium]|nr:type II toxin-antitoxin system mRNA interferase toxin, RelE/StbE family [Candidatus Paceibacterota bacterium]